MVVNRVLLVLVGSLSDLAFRKFLRPARELERQYRNVEVMLVDLPWNVAGVSPEQELRWRIARRAIDLLAEHVGRDKVAGVGLRFGLGTTIYPWEADAFVGNHLTGPADVLSDVRGGLRGEVDDWVKYFTATSAGANLPRYASSLDSVGSAIARLKGAGWKVAAFIATPPQAYPGLISRWRFLADRIALEKPATGLNPQTLLYDGPDELLAAAAGVPPHAQLVTSDHYNAKLITRVMDRTKNYGVFNHLLDTTRIQRVVVQLLEAAPLPPSRSAFYNGAGGPFGDMLPHILQAIRALLGVTTDRLEVRFGKNFCWARYEGAPLAGSFVAPTGAPYSYEPGYFQPLRDETETFVAFDATLKVGEREIPLYIRTGKGIHPERKSIRVDTCYDEHGSEISLTFSLGDDRIIIRDDSQGFVMETGKLIVQDSVETGVPGIESEYKGILECLVTGEWGPEGLNPRYFPPVPDAVKLSTLVFEELVRHRSARSSLRSYNIAQPSTYSAILGFLEHRARWS